MPWIFTARQALQAMRTRWKHTATAAVTDRVTRTLTAGAISSITIVVYDYRSH